MKSLEIKDAYLNWNDLLISLNELFDQNFKQLDNFINKCILKDGKCYEINN